jgi:hypothetical protein
MIWQKSQKHHGSETILFVGAHYEVNGSEIMKYYFAGTQRIAIPQSEVYPIIPISNP